MNGSYNSKLGSIIIDNNVIAKIAGLAALECFGVVGMAALSKSDGIVKLLTRNSIAKGVRIETQNNSVFIEMHVIVAYGISIAAVAENLVDAVKYSIENVTGFTVEKVNIIVEGVRVID